MPYERYVSLYLHVNGKDRLTKVTHKLGTGAAVTLAEYTYDALGRQSTKKQGTDTSTYSYNIRNWLTGISSTKFTQTLGYGSDYNGNISSINWNANGSSHSYTFTYDGVNRMLNATHGTGAYTEKVTLYDKNGNIKALQRYGNGLIDNLTYTYSGNQLTRVDDATGNAAGFSNGASAANEYTYDNNGNLTKDSNKGITNIAYNCLNLPSRVTFGDGSTIVYTYAADGTKLRTVHTISGTSTQKDYCANVVYENGVQKMLLTEEGYVDLSNNTYYYYLKDHQGNNRVVVSSGGTVAEVNHYYPFGSVFASSSNVQPYKYNGKELDTKKGLNWYDYGARHYDATLGRWLVVDPLVEKYYAWSPYNYCANNPIKFVDPNGKGIDIVWDLFNVWLGTKSFKNNISVGNYGAAIVDGVGVVLDATAAALPFIPGGVSSGIKAARVADNIADAVSTTNKVDNATDAVRTVEKFEIVIDTNDKINRNLLNPPTKWGNAPTFKKDGKPVEIHHEQQSPNGPFREMHPNEHRGKGYDKENHPNKNLPSSIDRNEFYKAKREYWKNEYKEYFNR